MNYVEMKPHVQPASKENSNLLLRIRHQLKNLIPKNLLEYAARFGFFRKITGYGYHGLNKIDREIAKYLPKNRGYYIELGANNGIRQSNTLYFERYLNYRGVLIEPHKATFDECVSNRDPENEFRNAACVGFDFKGSSLQLIYSGLMTTPVEGRSDIPDKWKHAKSGAQFLKDEKIEIFEARAVTLDSILREVNAPEIIQLLSLDVEGGELEVLSGVNFIDFRFEIICVETRSPSVVTNFLAKNGYKIKKKISHHDYLFEPICKLGRND